MAVIRVNKTKDYTIMSNSHFKNKNLSLKAKGLLSEMLSLPEDWDYTIAGLVSINKENETAIKSTLKELEKEGYLKITKLYPDKTETGRIEYIYDIYEKKQNLENQDIEKQGIENLPLEIQQVEYQGQLNTNNKKLNNKELNNKKLNNIYIPYEEIINYLNLKANKNYKSTISKTRSLIQARFNEGFNLNDFKIVIDKKCKEWLKTEFEKYLRPETLFSNKFEGYLNQTETQKEISKSARQLKILEGLANGTIDVL